MTKISKTVVFFGNERLATGVSTNVPTLRALLAAGYHVAAVVSNYEIGTSRSARSLEIAEVAEQHGIPVLLPTKPSEIIDQLAAFEAPIGILVAYGKIVPQAVIDIFPKGIVNIHPSLLPLHRGPIPIESVILDGSKETGVSLMQLVKAMDAGPVFVQEKLYLSGDETKQELADKLLQQGSHLLIETLPSILDDSRSPTPQDDDLATYDQLLTKDSGTIDWQKPATQIEREIRAFLGWPKSRTELAGKEVIITQARVVPETGQPEQAIIKDKQLIVAAGSDALLIEKIKPAGKPEMSGEAFLVGYRNLLS